MGNFRTRIEKRSRHLCHLMAKRCGPHEPYLSLRLYDYHVREFLGAVRPAEDVAPQPISQLWFFGDSATSCSILAVTGSDTFY